MFIKKRQYLFKEGKQLKMIDIKFSGNFDQELENLFQNLEEEKANQKISQNFISPYCYDLKSIASNNESQILLPAPIHTEPHSSPLSKAKH